MKILFTKKSNEKEVSEKLGSEFDVFFMDFIQIKFLKVDEFNTEFSTLIFTSKNGVFGFLENGFFFRKNQKIFCVGSKTKKLIEENGGEVSENFKKAEELSQYLKNLSGKETFLHFCGNLTLDTLENSIENYKAIEVYETELLYPKISEKFDAIVFFSPSGVRSFAKFNSLENMKIFSIGETTSKEIRKYTENQVFTSKENNLEDLLKLIISYR